MNNNIEISRLIDLAAALLDMPARQITQLLEYGLEDGRAPILPPYIESENTAAQIYGDGQYDGMMRLLFESVKPN